MKKYIVVRPFRDISGFKRAGDWIELDAARAAKLRSHGLIAGIVLEDQPKNELTEEELEELTDIYPESKVYKKKKEAKKPSKKVK